MPIKDNKMVIMSYSSFSCWKQCPARYYRQKILREPRPEEDTTFTLPGRVVHVAAEDYLKTGSTELFKEEALREATIRHSSDEGMRVLEHYKNIDEVIKFVLQCGENLLWFLTSSKFYERGNFKAEEWFGTWDEPLMLSPTLGIQGAADIIQINDNATAIPYDYKATWSAKNMDPDQLLIYSVAAKLKWSLDCTMSAFYLLPARKHQYYSFTRDQRVGLVYRLQAAADQILAGNFPTTPNDKCDRCPYFNSCQDARKVKSKLPQWNSELPTMPSINL